MINNPMFNNFMNFQNQFNMFRQQMTSQRVDPQAKVQELLNSGQMSQEQFNQLRMMANMITGRNV